MRGTIAYFKKSFLTAFQYKFNIFMGYLAPFIGLIILYIYFQTPLKRASNIIVNIDNFSILYFQYAISGVALSFYQLRALRSFCQEMEGAKQVGQLEILLSSSTSFGKIIGAMFLWRLVFSLIVTSPFLILATYLVREYYVFSFFKVLLIIMVLLFSVALFFCFALCIAGLVLVFDRVMYFVGLLIQGFMVLGDIFIPIYLLPDPIKTIAEKVPIRLYLNPLRGIVFNNYSLVDIMPDLYKLFIIIVIMFPISFIFFRLCLKKVMVDGTLGRY